VRTPLITTLCFLLATLGLLGCTSTGGGNRAIQRLITAGQYEDAARILLLQVSQNPMDADAVRLLGIAQYHLEDFGSAEKSLRRTLELDPRDAVGHFYAGLLAERTNEIDRALYHYQSFQALQGKGDLADRARRRVEDLKAAQAAEFAQQAIANEKEISPAQFPDSTIGVVYFNSRFLSDPLRPLATGLAELTTVDLSKVAALRVVERVRLNKILAELRLSHSGAFDTSTAPRLGKLLGAAHVLGGGLAELPGEQLRIDPNLVNTKSGEVALPDEAVGGFADFLRMQKQIVFATLDELGISLTRAEHDSIAQLPTTSFRAFLMYSRGLELLDGGNLKSAEKEFQRAVEIDPNFRDARDKLQLTETLAGTPPSGTLAEFQNRAENNPLIRGRTGDLSHTLVADQIRLGFLPETRVGADEPYTGPYGGQPASGTVIIEGRFEDE